MSHHTIKQQSGMDTFSRAVVARLSESTDQLPHEITERLRAARMQALANRKVAAAVLAPEISFTDGQAALQGDGAFGGLWSKFASVLPLIALVVGLFSIGWIQDEIRANELAKVDSELLIDELPPAAYVDPGFVEFLRKNQGN